MVRLYADEGITGTSMKKRKEFLRMLRDCDRGRIDLVITKSVSRFGRNTLDGLDTVRKLKRKGIGVYFEKENVNTLYIDNEMILTFMMSQAESESLSGNVKWGHRKNFRDGKVYYHYASFLGYRKGADGLPEIDPDEAAIVRRIFARYLLGQSVRQICRDLMADGVKTTQGSDSWHDSVVRKMLQNEKYIGDALLQKTFMADLFTHEQRKNMGELPQYYVHEFHPAIIDRDTFQRVQEELSLPALEAQIRSLQERQIELFQLAVSASPDCLDYDEEIQRVNAAKTSLIAKKAKLEREGRTAAAFDQRMADIAKELEQTAGIITEFDEVTVRQLVSNIKVVSKDTLLICFKDGTEITQTV